MISPLVTGAVSKKADDHIVFLPHLKRQSGAGGNGKISADNCVGCHGSYGDIPGMHCAALAAAAALGLTKHFAHHRPDRNPLGKIMPRRTMGRSHPIIFS